MRLLDLIASWRYRWRVAHCQHKWLRADGSALTGRVRCMGCGGIVDYRIVDGEVEPVMPLRVSPWPWQEWPGFKGAQDARQ